MVSELLKGRGLWLQVSCSHFPQSTRRFVDRGEMTYNSYMQYYILVADLLVTEGHVRRGLAITVLNSWPMLLANYLALL